MAHPHAKGGPDSGAISTAATVVYDSITRIFQQDPAGTFLFPELGCKLLIQLRCSVSLVINVTHELTV